jgi:hypothetical protein
MAPNARAQKKRKTAPSASAGAEHTPHKSVSASPPATAVPTKTSPDGDDGGDSDKYASAESSSEDELDDDEGADEFSHGSGSDEDSDDSISSLVAAQNLQQQRKKRKRHDPAAFSTSMAKILGSHLTTAARKDPVLVRAKQTAEHVDDGKLEAKARRVLKDELRREKEKGRVRDLVPREDDEAAGKALEKEKALRSIARSGVAKLYNAVRAAQIRAEEAAKGVRKEGIVGMDNRDAKGGFFSFLHFSMLLQSQFLGITNGRVSTVTEMSKQGFLDLIQASK